MHSDVSLSRSTLTEVPPHSLMSDTLCTLLLNMHMDLMNVYYIYIED